MEGGHDVPITKIISRYVKSLYNCYLAAKLSDRTYLYDNSIDYSEAKLLFRLCDGKIAKTYVDELPEWGSRLYSKFSE